MDNEGCESSHCARLSCGKGIDKGAWLFVPGKLIEREERGSDEREAVEQRGVGRVTCVHSQGPVETVTSTSETSCNYLSHHLNLNPNL